VFTPLFVGIILGMASMLNTMQPAKSDPTQVQTNSDNEKKRIASTTTTSFECTDKSSDPSNLDPCTLTNKEDVNQKQVAECHNSPDVHECKDSRGYVVNMDNYQIVSNDKYHVTKECDGAPVIKDFANKTIYDNQRNCYFRLLNFEGQNN